MFFCYFAAMRADRLLSILLLLQANGRMTAHTLATRLEVSERTILRDMDALSSAGIPVVAERGAGGGWRLVGGYETKLTGLTPTEIQTLFLARPPQLMADLGLKDAAEAAWLKLRAALPTNVREQAEFVRQRILIDPRGWRDSAETITSLPVLLEGLWRDRKIGFRYEKSQDDTGQRVVDPLGLVARGSHWYLVATRRDEARTYRVSRIRDAEVLAEASVRAESFDLAAHWEQSSARFRAQLPQHHATYLVTPAVLPWLRWYRRWRLVEETTEGDRVRVTLRFDAAEEALQFALAFGVELEVVAPKELRERVMATAAAVVATYARADASGSS
jgi:predicted DNA-binding transcriptional regulator YafY